MLRGYDPVANDLVELLRCHACVCGRDDLDNGGIAAAERTFEIALEQRGKRLLVVIGCSAHSVPSLSKVAMRSAGGTKSGEPCFVTRSTKPTMAFLGAVSFHDASGSWAMPGAVHDIEISATAVTQETLILDISI